MPLLPADDPWLQAGQGLQRARADVVAVSDADPAVADAAQRILDWIDGHDDALLRSCLAAHLTGSALVVNHDASQVLLLHHTKLQRWLQPGGHADGEGNLAATALKEAAEETGIEGLRIAVPALDLDVHEVAPPKEGPHLHMDVRYLVVAPPGALPQGNHESTALRWVDPADLDAYEPDPGLRRLIAVGLAAARQLLAADHPATDDLAAKPADSGG